MRVLVLGAGVIGTTSAYYLAKAGFKVTVLERQSGVAEKPVLPMRAAFLWLLGSVGGASYSLRHCNG